MAAFLVVAALRSEAAYLPEGVPVVITGIGKTNAAIETTRALLAYGDTADLIVLNVGTAGALQDGLTGLHRPSSVLNHDLSADAIRALGIDPEERVDLRTGDGTVLASGDVFVSDPAVRARLAQHADLVDMEAYGVALACRRLGVDLELVKHVSDNADEGAFDWPSAVDASAQVLGAWVTQRLGSGS
ncbi:nucleosidase [Nocardioides marmoriginsengisoli]|uniref:Nucleosidase n=1 Tax=Nocardioides marmoriginsengisoli TaxID=661483 RepID=A0A3N0CR28_9ACTN|nr:nucleosidase [Nocardioides marmoriginsengisoli]RNL65789.1 nucleosidase [Nocardioides marmoriginsengisoli]